MAPPLIFLDAINLNFGGQPLLEGAGISISAQDRLCLVGRNGSGKSTLMKIVAGTVEADSGEIFRQPGVAVSYLAQEPDLKNYETVEDFVLAGPGPSIEPHNARVMLEELGLDQAKNTSELSGGEARRVALVTTLCSEADILLLDEPTNHLDLPAIEWLENQLGRSKAALVLISHDRRFLESLSQKTLWMDRGQSRMLDFGFGKFESWRDDFLEEEETRLHKLGRKIAREEHWVVHGVSGRRKRNVRRLKELQGLKHEKRDHRKIAAGVNITMAEAETSGKLVARLHQVTKSFGDQKIIENFSAIIQRGDRVGIVGPNGSGKTTMINLITGQLPCDSGKVKLGANLDTLIIDQKREMLDPEWTLKDALTDGSGDMVSIGEEQKHVMTYMRDFLFLPEQAGTPLHVLSGGERGRLMLARGFRNPSNFLVLDEPTNDLDLETLDLLQEKIAEFEGTVLLVSHDRDFLDRICTSVIASDGGGVWHQYAGGYSDMVAQRGHGVSGLKKENDKVRVGTKNAKAHETTNAQENPREQAQAAGLTNSQRNMLQKLPGEIERLEFEIDRLKEALAVPGLYEESATKFEKLAKELEKRERLLEEKEERWLELAALEE